MELIDYISTDKIAIGNQKTIQQILSIINDVNYSHIPILHNNKLIGNIAKEDINGIENTANKIGELEYLYEPFFAKSSDTLLQLFSNFAIHNTNILPVIDDSNNYIGYLDLNDLLSCFANTPFLSAEGSIIQLEKKNSEYSMSEICQIVESNSNTILGFFIFEQTEESTKVTIKVKSLNINEIIQTFRRYDYTILNNHNEDSYLDGLKKRSEYFIKYLNI